MYLRLHDAMRKDERGFTLIELMVVVLIIAILIAIAIPSFLSARKRAQRRQAQTSLKTTQTTEQTYYTDSQDYTESTTLLEAEEPNLDYTTGASTDPMTVSVDVSTDGQTYEIASWSKSKDCYYLWVNQVSGTVKSKTEDGGQASCTAEDANPNGTGTTKTW